MKRILIFSLAYYPHMGGAEYAIKEITDRIPDMEFHLLTLRFSSKDLQEEKIDNTYVHRIGFGGAYVSKILFVPLAALAARRLHRQTPFDALWAMMSYMTLPVILARMLGARAPYVLTLQDGDPFEHVFKRWYIRPFVPLMRRGFRNATIVQTISTYLANWTRQLGYKGKVEVIPNGVDIQKFSGDLVPHKDTVLITTSRLVHKNAVDDIIRALAFLSSDIRLQVLGSGPLEANLKALVKELALESRVAFLGNIPNPELPRYLHAADVFIRPSRSEGMGNSFVEAFAAGLPVIATKEGGLKDFISRETAWPVSKDSPEKIAEAVKEILANPGQTRRVIEHAKALAFEKYDWNLIAQDMRERVLSPCLKP